MHDNSVIVEVVVVPQPVYSGKRWWSFPRHSKANLSPTFMIQMHINHNPADPS